MIELILIIQILGVLILGILAGCFTGLIPGLHINMLAFLIVSYSIYLSRYFSLIILASFIVVVSITHTFIDFIPSIFLGSPDEDTTLSILPGHSMLLEGKGHEAVLYTLYGGLVALGIILVFSPIFILFLPKIYPFIKSIMFFILLLASFYLLFKESNILLSVLIFAMSGLIGFSSMILPIKESLLPMLTGLFGASSLITSIIKKKKIPKQRISKADSVKIKDILKIIIPTSLASPICSFLPALGSGQAAIISSDMMKKSDKKSFLMLIGSINTIVMGLSIISLYSLNVNRTGSAVAISNLLPSLSMADILIFISVMIISGIASFFIAKKVSRFFAGSINKINYNKLSFFILLFLSIIVLGFSEILGFLIFVVSALTGLFAISVGARRTLLMGCLMIPTILFYLPF